MTINVRVNVTLGRIRVRTLAAEVQKMLHILSESL
jgi:hypothetical protein